MHERGVTQRVAIQSDMARAALLREAGLTVEEFDFSGGFRGWRERRRLQRLADEFRPDVALAFMNRAARRMPSGTHVKIGRIGGYYRARHYRRCDWIIANAPDLVRHIVEDGWREDRVELISNFGELPDAAPVPRASFGTPDDAPLLLAMGRCHPSKGFDMLLEAVARLPAAHLWLAGEGGERAALETMAGDLGIAERVRFLGWRDDQAALLAACDICVVPSRHEPLSNVTVEAWAARRCVVALPSEGPSWLVEDGKNGVLCGAITADALTRGLLAVLRDTERRARLAEAGHATWRQRFSREAIVDRYLDLFERVRS